MNIPKNHSLDVLLVCQYASVPWTCTYTLLSPVFVYMLYVGLKQCRKTRSSSSNSTHSDVFTFNMAAVEMVGVVSACIYMVLLFTPRLFFGKEVIKTLMHMVSFGQTLLHILVCLDRYLAVVHPITYLHMKKNGAAVRNASIAAAWMLSFGMGFVYPFERGKFLLILMTTGALSLALITFLCASVLCVLVRPGPGNRGGVRKRVDQSKRRALHTMTAITAVLMLKFVTMFVAYMVDLSDKHNQLKKCALGLVAQWFNIPSSLVMPLLFLCRRVQPCKTNTK